MAILVPNSQNLVLSGPTTEDFIDDYEGLLSGVGGTWSTTNVIGDPVTSFTLQHTSGFQLNYRMDAGQLLSMIAPVGGIVDSSAPGTPTRHSPESVLLPALAGTQAKALLSIYDDAIITSIKNAAGNASPVAFHHGKPLGLPFIRPNGPTGFGVFAYVPRPNTDSTPYGWFSNAFSAGQRVSWVEVEPGVWRNPGLVRGFDSATTAADAGNRLTYGSVVTGNSGAAPSIANPAQAFLKYVFGDTDASNPTFQVIPGDTSDQSILRLSSNTTTRMGFIWDWQTPTG